MTDHDYKGYTELCEALELPYALSDHVEKANHKIMKALLERILELEKTQHYHAIRPNGSTK